MHGVIHSWCMPVYIFASETHTAVSALMSDHTGDNLPQDYAPWRPVNNGRALPAGPQAHSIVEAIQRDGFFLISREDQAGDVSRDGPQGNLSGWVKGGRGACGAAGVSTTSTAGYSNGVGKTVPVARPL
jgi:hypothetical protein